MGREERRQEGAAAWAGGRRCPCKIEESQNVLGYLQMFGNSEIKHYSYLNLFGKGQGKIFLNWKALLIFKINCRISYMVFSRQKNHFGLCSFYQSEMQDISNDNLPNSNKANVIFPV